MTCFHILRIYPVNHIQVPSKASRHSCLPATATSSVIGPVGSGGPSVRAAGMAGPALKSSLVLGPTQNRKLFESLANGHVLLPKSREPLCRGWGRYSNLAFHIERDIATCLRQWDFIKVFVESISFTLLRCYLNMPEVCSTGSIIIISSMKWTNTVSYGMER